VSIDEILASVGGWISRVSREYAIILRKLSTAWDQRSKPKQFPFSNSQVNQV